MNPSTNESSVGMPKPYASLVRLIAALVLLLVGCGTEGSDVVDCGAFELRGAWSQDEREDIETAASRFYAWSGREVRLDPSATCSISPARIESREVGRAYEDGRILIDRERWTDDSGCRQAVVLHELGHMLGLEHLPDGERGIMAERSAQMTHDFTDADREECLRAGVCR